MGAEAAIYPICSGSGSYQMFSQYLLEISKSTHYVSYTPMNIRQGEAFYLSGERKMNINTWK